MKNLVRASIVIMSHLSDAREEIIMNGNTDNNSVCNHINFAKYIIFHTGGNLNVQIDPDEMYEKYLGNE
jgi:hypothetical protein